MFDKVINNIGVSVTLLFMVIELAWINSRSLLYLTNSTNVFDQTFCVIGSIAYSLVTVTVMRKSASLAMRIIFPLFDIVFVFLGFNIYHTTLISTDPVRFYLSVVVALFTGLIIFSLGMINLKDHVLEAKKTIEDNKELQEILKYKAVFLAAEKSRILKKKPKNRTPDDLRTLREYECN